RRTFLKQSAFATLAAAPAVKSFTALARRGSAKKVIVIGAGLAGLSAAYELKKAGHDVTILEARTRAGGRVYTLREPFSGGLYAEAGAMWIPQTHDLTLGYIKEFGLELEPFSLDAQKTVDYIRGRRYVVEDNTPLDPFKLTAEERALGVGGLRRKYLSAVRQA